MSRTLLTIIDYGMGNLHSVAKALEHVAPNTQVEVTSDKARIAEADHILLPGVGAIRDCMAEIRRQGVDTVVADAVNSGKPFLGICVGMQLMATLGREYSDTPGLDWIGGEVTKITPADPSLKVPHMGWNDLVIDHPHAVFDGVSTGDHAYFVHSYHMVVQDEAQRLAHVDYAGDVTAIIGRGTMLGMQFHPEKSQATGLRLIANFLNWKP